MGVWALGTLLDKGVIVVHKVLTMELNLLYVYICKSNGIGVANLQWVIAKMQ